MEISIEGKGGRVKRAEKNGVPEILAETHARTYFQLPQLTQIRALFADFEPRDL